MTYAEKVKILSKQVKLLIEEVKKISYSPFNEGTLLSLYYRIEETTGLIKRPYVSCAKIDDEVFSLLVELIEALDEYIRLLDKQIENGDPLGYIKFVNEVICRVIRSSMNIKYVVTCSSELKSRYIEMRKQSGVLRISKAENTKGGL